MKDQIGRNLLKNIKTNSQMELISSARILHSEFSKEWTEITLSLSRIWNSLENGFNIFSSRMEDFFIFCSSQQLHLWHAILPQNGLKVMACDFHIVLDPSGILVVLSFQCKRAAEVEGTSSPLSNMQLLD